MKIDTSELTDVELYKLRLQGKLKKFPDGFWKKPGALDSAKEITIYFIEEILKWNEEDIRKKIDEKTFREYKLSGMLEYVFDRSPFKAIENAYPGVYKEWDLKHVSRNLWEDENKRKKAIEWLLNKVEKDTFEELTNIDFTDNGLGGLLDRLYRKGYFKDLNKESLKSKESYKERVLNISFNKSGGNSSRNSMTTRLTLPTSWIKKLGITEQDREVIVKIEGDKIIIRKK
ncbi:AbrB/MazE/SpoVT family DNA-binding domain-containing protein [Clostridium botulinum]|uniref:AbrB/MazE/SpoVT family DNA-binding domain-containing protein n=1 Tax=Clostridium botulinum TaxID=1491 RepID=UPI00388EAF6A